MPRARRLVVMTNYRRGSLSVPRRSRCAARPSGGRPRLRRTSRTGGPWYRSGRRAARWSRSSPRRGRRAPQPRRWRRQPAARGRRADRASANATSVQGSTVFASEPTSSGCHPCAKAVRPDHRNRHHQLPTCTRTSHASSQIDQPEAKVAKAWIMNEPLAGLGRVSKSASLLHGHRPCPAARTGSALKSFRPCSPRRYGRETVSLLGAHEVRVWSPRQFPGWKQVSLWHVVSVSSCSVAASLRWWSGCGARCGSRRGGPAG